MKELTQVFLQLEIESDLQTGVYLSVERSNTVTLPSPDTVANTVLVTLQRITINIINIIMSSNIIVVFPVYLE